ncbi:S26 family signal peptidase [bacterium AH-315-J23]|nr:S26 family signal peptidase [bacterium AH-315-J23]PHQ60903.1 MAG: plasmid transfer protein traf [Robiginitomaculum sp.]
MIWKALMSIAAMLLLLASSIEIVFPPKPVLLYNPSESAPVGWYKLRPKEPLANDTLVAAYAPEAARRLAHERDYLPYDYPLIKTIWAMPGAYICIQNNRVRVPNRPDIYQLKQDGLGRIMPKLSGCFTLGYDEYFLISKDVQAGFDSRYFGPVTGEMILGKVQYLGGRKNGPTLKRAVMEGEN